MLFRSQRSPTLNAVAHMGEDRVGQGSDDAGAGKDKQGLEILRGHDHEDQEGYGQQDHHGAQIREQHQQQENHAGPGREEDLRTQRRAILEETCQGNHVVAIFSAAITDRPRVE